MAALLLGGCGAAVTPDPVYPVPTEAQVEWQKMETYAFIHFGPNTFNDMEWGYGDADPAIFNPASLDCEQWASTLAAAGMKGVILTAKHHDGFCLWPTAYTDYNISATPYKDGKGDIVGELAAACRKYGLKFGVYLSPWDRHQAFYGTPEYIEYYRNQLRELLTNYGDIFEMWFDGANGGDGYYGGARERRRIDARTYYDYENTYALVYELQPSVVLFSDGGPGCRWVGNEKGIGSETNWSFLRGSEVYAGYPQYEELGPGHVDGTDWIPAECDVSIRPGWFYHESEDDAVKTPEELLDLYFRNVGRNCNFILNVPVDKDGLIHPTDSANVVNFRKLLDAKFAVNLLDGATAEATSSVRGRKGEAVVDSDYDTFWSPDPAAETPEITVTLKEPAEITTLVLQEYIPLGQRVAKFSVEISDGEMNWTMAYDEETTTIGYKRILRFKPTLAESVKIRFEEFRGPVCISTIAAY